MRRNVLRDCGALCAGTYRRVRNRTSPRTRVLLAVALTGTALLQMGSQLEPVKAWYATTYNLPTFGGW